MTTCFLLALAVSSAPQTDLTSADATLPAAGEGYRILSMGYGPEGVVRVKRPTFSWNVQPQNGARVTDNKIWINGKKVEGSYDAAHQEVCYTPPLPLTNGEYKVQMQVQVSAKVYFRKEWKTTVPTDAVDRLPSPTDRQLEIFRILNAQREAIGLEPFALDDSLCAAADSHAVWLADNTATGHEQTEGSKSFTGHMPWDRTRAFGFSGGTWEAAGYEISDPHEAFSAIFDAPYHRLPFLQPGTARVGIGVSKRGTVIDGEMPTGHGTVVSPGDGQTNVPVSWRGYERPDPLRHWSELQRPTGYPIVLADYGGTGKLEVSEGHLYLDDTEVKSFLATPAMDDHLTDATILIPARPLGKGKTYRVRISALRDGRDVSRTWSFTTAS